MARVTFQETMDRLLLLIRAGYPVIYIVSHEEARVLDNVARIVRILSGDRKRAGLPEKRLVRWYQGLGLRAVRHFDAVDKTEPVDWLSITGIGPGDPEDDQALGGETGEAALENVRAAGPNNFGDLSDAVAVFFDLHPFLMMDKNTGISGELVRPLRNAADRVRRYSNDNRETPGQPYKTIIIVAPSASGLSPELERDLIQIGFPLPERGELLNALEAMLAPRGQAGRGVGGGVPPRLSIKDPPSPEEMAALCRDGADSKEYRARLSELVAGAGRGLTLEDYRSGLNMFAVREEPLSARHIDDMLQLKSKAISSPALQYTPNVRVELGGLAEVIDWVGVHREAASSEEIRILYHLPPPRGLMLLGVSGGGKTH